MTTAAAPPSESSTAPLRQLPGTSYPVYFLSPRDGQWRLQHTFTSRECAVECAKNLVRYASAVVNEMVVEDGKIVDERQILEVRADGRVTVAP